MWKTLFFPCSLQKLIYTKKTLNIIYLINSKHNIGSHNTFTEIIQFFNTVFIRPLSYFQELFTFVCEIVYLTNYFKWDEMKEIYSISKKIKIGFMSSNFQIKYWHHFLIYMITLEDTRIWITISKHKCTLNLIGLTQMKKFLCSFQTRWSHR